MKCLSAQHCLFIPGSLEETSLHSSAWPGNVCHTFSLPQPYLSEISLPQPSSSSRLTVWHRHTKPTQPLTKPRYCPLFEHAGVDNCWEIWSARQWTNPLRLIVIPANERRFVALAIKDKSLFFGPLLPVTKLVGAAGIRPTADPSLPRPGPFLPAQLGSPGQWGSCVCCATPCWVYSLDSPRIRVYSPPWMFRGLIPLCLLCFIVR